MAASTRSPAEVGPSMSCEIETASTTGGGAGLAGGLPGLGSHDQGAVRWLATRAGFGPDRN